MQIKTIMHSLAMLGLLAILLPAKQAYAIGLMEAYEAALANDSVYRSARHDNEAGQQYKVIGRANLLPKLSANYAYNKNKSDITTSNNGRTFEEDRDYNSENGAIQLRQPIINLEGWARYRQGNLQTALSDKQFLSSKQEVIQRFFGLYAQANYAEHVLALSLAERDAFKVQAEANKLMAARGEGTKTALLEAQAKLNLSEAQVIESQNAVVDGHYALAAMMGKTVEQLDQLSDNFNVQPLMPASFAEWKAIALNNNPEIAAQKESVALAYQEVKRNRAGHAPTLDAVASISRTQSDTVATFNQEIDNNSLGLQLNIPIYSGGSVSALTSQAVSNYHKEQDNLETKTNEVLLDLRKQFNTVLSSTLKVDALKQSVESAQLLITATKKSMVGGIRTNLDVLDARKQLFEANRDLSAARYNYLVAYINLKKAAGTLTEADLEKIAVHFVPKR